MGLAFSTLSIALTVVVVEVVEREATRHVERSIGHGLGELALQASDKLDRGMFERYREVGLIAKRFALADAGLGHDDWRRMLDDVRQTYNYYSWIGLADLQGKVMVSAGGLLEGADVSARPWFQEARKGDGHVGDVHEALLLSRLLPQSGGEPLRFVDIAFPFRDRDGKERGVLGAHLSWQWARDVERSIIEPLEAERQVQALIVGANGVVLLGPPNLQGRTVDFTSLQEARGDNRPGYVVEKGIDGKTYMTGYSRSKGYADYPGLGWTVLVRQDIDNALVPVKRLRRYGLWSGIGLALLFSIAGVFVARWITRPLMQLGAEAARISQGGGAAIAPQNRAYDEVQALAGTLNALVSDQRRRQAQLEELNATLEQRVQERTQALAEALSVVRQSGQRINAIVESAQDAFIGIDLRGRIMDWNSQAEAMFGWSRDEVIGRSLGALIVPERFLAHFERAIRMANETGHLEMFERRAERIVQTRGGAELPVEVTAKLVVGPGTDFFSIFLRDISLRKKVEQMKNELVATVSHELRTPLTSMRASLSLLDSGAVEGVPDDAMELIEIAHRHCERLVRMVNEMLDVEKVESGHVHLVRAEQELAPILRDAVAAMQGHARQAGVRLDCAGTLPGVCAEVDGDRLTQVITNLLSNAIKFAPAGSAVEAALGWHGDGVRIAVLDRGPGIPLDFRARIFERFAQAEDEARRRQGSGLGLSISKRIVEEHGGRIGFEDRPGGGTVFYVDLPVHADDAARAALESAK
ncbi:sensor histidine kinase [Herbaspirillum sp. SJZ107]|uniref:sensor histidine kinase n=1 Tax=Herbaspirillum sp. SJZ107 TaxID=2572881 RepID=UPI0011705491|nr:sensor histidine kinase [Herbaspirillum sp. SJZ107]TQK11889.1 PAS domain S-box-containing protein [Herbaspirillum sp. SJZ107]